MNLIYHKLKLTLWGLGWALALALGGRPGGWLYLGAWLAAFILIPAFRRWRGLAAMLPAPDLSRIERLPRPPSGETFRNPPELVALLEKYRRTFDAVYRTFLRRAIPASNLAACLALIPCTLGLFVSFAETAGAMAGILCIVNLLIFLPLLLYAAYVLRNIAVAAERARREARVRELRPPLDPDDPALWSGWSLPWLAPFAIDFCRKVKIDFAVVPDDELAVICGESYSDAVVESLRNGGETLPRTLGEAVWNQFFPGIAPVMLPEPPARPEPPPQATAELAELRRFAEAGQLMKVKCSALRDIQLKRPYFSAADFVRCWPDRLHAAAALAILLIARKNFNCCESAAYPDDPVWLWVWDGYHDGAEIEFIMELEIFFRIEFTEDAAENMLHHWTLAEAAACCLSPDAQPRA